MEEDEEERLTEYLRKLDAVETLDWLAKAWAGEERTPTDTNWWVWMAEHAETSADYTPDLTWGQVATSIYEYLNANALPDQVNSFLTYAMLMRARLIHKFGAVPKHPLLDSTEIARLFFDNLRLPYERVVKQLDAAGEIESWYELKNTGQVTRREYVGLVLMWDQLSFIQGFVDDGILVPDQALRSWLDLRTRFPWP